MMNGIPQVQPHQRHQQHQHHLQQQQQQQPQPQQQQQQPEQHTPQQQQMTQQQQHTPRQHTPQQPPSHHQRQPQSIPHLTFPSNVMMQQPQQSMYPDYMPTAPASVATPSTGPGSILLPMPMPMPIPMQVPVPVQMPMPLPISAPAVPISIQLPANTNSTSDNNLQHHQYLVHSQSQQHLYPMNVPQFQQQQNHQQQQQQTPQQQEPSLPHQEQLRQQPQLQQLYFQQQIVHPQQQQQQPPQPPQQQQPQPPHQQQYQLQYAQAQTETTGASYFQQQQQQHQQQQQQHHQQQQQQHHHQQQQQQQQQHHHHHYQQQHPAQYQQQQQHHPVQYQQSQHAASYQQPQNPVQSFQASLHQQQVSQHEVYSQQQLAQLREGSHTPTSFQLAIPDGFVSADKIPKKIHKLSSFKMKPQKKVSAFVSKLYSMLHDPDLSHLIWWSRLNQNDFTTFALLPGSEFATCLSTYFKHGNVASFVRQLHMYGFHKVCESNYQQQQQAQQHHIQRHQQKNSFSNGYPHSNPNQTVWEFRHSSGKFKRGDQNHLYLIRRRAYSRRNSGDSAKSDIATDNEGTENVTSAPVIQPLQTQESADIEESNIVSVKSTEKEESPVGEPLKTPGRIKYSPVYYKEGENKEKEREDAKEEDETKDKKIDETKEEPDDKKNKEDDNNTTAKKIYRVSTPKQDQQERTKSEVTLPSIPLRGPFSQFVSPFPAKSIAGKLSPVSYKQNVFSQTSRERYASIFVDPCAPVPTSNPNTENTTLQLPSIDSNVNRANLNQDVTLPSISSISSQSSLHFYTSRNSSVNSVGGSQLRPSLFDLHNGISTYSLSATSAQNSIFSGSSISSVTSSGSRIGSSISSILNEDNHKPQSSLSGPVSTPICMSSSLKTIVSVEPSTAHSPPSSQRTSRSSNDEHSTIINESKS